MGSQPNLAALRTEALLASFFETSHYVEQPLTRSNSCMQLDVFIPQRCDRSLCRKLATGMNEKIGVGLPELSFQSPPEALAKPLIEPHPLSFSSSQSRMIARWRA